MAVTVVCRDPSPRGGCRERREGDRLLTRLDVYAPARGDNHPVVVWIHGGAWRIGDKSRVQSKPGAFNDRGYVFVSVNYRLHPAVTNKEQAGDIARAIRWVYDHVKDHGGDPERIFLMGHSAGAHLAALVATDERYLGETGLKLSDLSGVILLDGAGYDIPLQVRQAVLPRMKTMYTAVFTEDEATQRDASPITHVAPGKGIPPFLILHVASRKDSKIQSDGLAAKLRRGGVEAKVVPADQPGTWAPQRRPDQGGVRVPRGSWWNHRPSLTRSIPFVVNDEHENSTTRPVGDEAGDAPVAVDGGAGSVRLAQRDGATRNATPRGRSLEVSSTATTMTDPAESARLGLALPPVSARSRPPLPSPFLARWETSLPARVWRAWSRGGLPYLRHKAMRRLLGRWPELKRRWLYADPRDYWTLRGGHDYFLEQEGQPARTRRAEWMADRVARLRPRSILEVGCGYGKQLVALRRRLGDDVRLAGVDFSPSQLETARGHLREHGVQRIVLAQADGARLPFDDGAFDLVFTSAVILHNPPEQAEAIRREVVRVARRFAVHNEDVNITYNRYGYDTAAWYRARGIVLAECTPIPLDQAEESAVSQFCVARLDAENPTQGATRFPTEDVIEGKTPSHGW